MEWNRTFYYYSLYFSGLFSQLRFVKISCIREKTCISDKKEYTELLPIKKPKKTYWIDTNINRELVDFNFKRIVQKEKDENADNVHYFCSYLKCFYDCEKTESEIERMLETIQDIRKTVKYEYPIYCSIYGKKVREVIRTTDPFYTKKSNDILVSLYKMEYCDKPAVVKVYEYFPEYVFSKCLIEDRFENEIIFQKYAETLRTDCEFVSPKVYCFGKIDDLIENVYLFLVMEYIDGLSIKHTDFRANVCRQIYEIDLQMKTSLLSHNDMKSRNILVSENEDIVVLDYGESSTCF